MGHRTSRLAMTAILGLSVLVGAPLADPLVAQTATMAPPIYREAPDDPPAAVAARTDASARSPAGRASRGPYLSIQVNVDELGRNIVGDAANEPSIAIDPMDPGRIVIGWRQFDNVASNFRQGGWGYSHDAGASWTFPGVLEPGIFRSDPVLDSDSEGHFFYESLTGEFLMDVFRSPDSGQSWLPGVPAWGGDKNWMVIDRTGGPGEGHVYGAWQRNFGCCGPDVFTRSVDRGESYETPLEVTDSPSFGTMAVGPDGTVYMVGTRQADLTNWVVARSTDAKDATSVPTFSSVAVDLGGSQGSFSGPNPDGLLGQGNIVVDVSGGDTHGNVYILASVDPPGADPLDIGFARSTDGGVTWSAPVRVNDDPPGADAYQWFGTLSVAPNGRLDAVWNDTRNGPSLRISELHYAYSWDAGKTWSENVPVSPPFDSYIGWPNQNKLGDYYTMISDAPGAGLAWAATFNGEQDVYFLRLFPDCNGNGLSDVDDIDGKVSSDDDGNHIPDECQDLVLTGPDPGLAGQVNEFVVSGAIPGDTVFLAAAVTTGSTAVPGCPGEALDLGSPMMLGQALAGGDGVARIERKIPDAAGGRTLYFQAVDRDGCAVSDRVDFSFR